MDELHRKDKYKAYVRKLEDAKRKIDGVEESDGSTVAFDEQSDHLLAALDNKKMANDFLMAFFGLAIIVIAACITSFFRYGYSIALMIILLLLLTFLFYYRSTMKAVVSKHNVFSDYKNMEKTTAEYMHRKLNFLKTRQHIILTRIKLIRNAFVVFFPLFLWMLQYISNKEVTEKHSLLFLGVAILLASPFWWFYFREEMDGHTQLKENIKNLEDSVLQN
jgi:hypothetical protein